MRKALAAAAFLAICATAAATTVQFAAAGDDEGSQERRSARPAVRTGLVHQQRDLRRAQPKRPTTREINRRIERINGRIERFRTLTRHWQTVMGEPRSPVSRAGRQIASREYGRWVLKRWQERAAETWERLRNPPHKTEWLCIHQYEGGWDDPNAPYWGGLQMDMGFQETYGAYLLQTKGTADHWQPLEQMWVAEKAFKTRGFTPWPNTAQSCGLL
jgi:hypothetical protein